MANEERMDHSVPGADEFMSHEALEAERQMGYMASGGEPAELSYSQELAGLVYDEAIGEGYDLDGTTKEQFLGLPQEQINRAINSYKARNRLH